MTIIFTFMRMQPPTIGHEKNLIKFMELQEKYNCDSKIMTTITNDHEYNPLSIFHKIKHIDRSFPEYKVQYTTKEAPSLIHNIINLCTIGYTRLIVVAGHDRVDEYKTLLNKYNGDQYDFKYIKVISSGQRNIGISGSEMRKYAKAHDFKSFKAFLPTRLRCNDQYAEELFSDIQKGLNVIPRTSIY